MEPLSQIDVANPDHVSVITREGKVTISVLKDGASVTLGFPLQAVFNTKPPIQLQQNNTMTLRDQKISREYQREAGLAYLQNLAVKDQGITTDDVLATIKAKKEKSKDAPKEQTSKVVITRNGNRKLTTADVKEIKEILANKAMVQKMGSRKQAYEDLAKAYGVTCFCIKAIDQGATWDWVKI